MKTTTIQNQNNSLILSEIHTITGGDYAGQTYESKTEVFTSHEGATKEANRRRENNSYLVHLENKEIVVDGVAYYFPTFNVWD